MKTPNFTKLLILLISINGVTYAQNSKGEKEEKNSATVIVLGQDNDPSVKSKAIKSFEENVRAGLQPDGIPRFLITDSKANAIFAIGGFVQFRTGYDFGGVIDHLDFIPYSIAVEPLDGNDRRFLMDASTSRLYFKTLIQTKQGVLEGYLSTDFRGANKTLRLREAYISYMGATFGQTFSTFCDLKASFSTIDFEGPNGFALTRNLLIRYEYGWKNGIKVAASLEYPSVLITHGDLNHDIYQRIPDIPAYINYAWKDGHVRLSGIVRNLFYYNSAIAEVDRAIGWGIKLSSSFKIGPKVQLFGEGTIGRGLAAYISDLGTSKFDLINDVNKLGEMIAPKTFAWFAGIQYNILPQMPFTFGYSHAGITNEEENLSGKDYRCGDFYVSNLFYRFSPYWYTGIEYLHGSRTNQDNQSGYANRIQAVIQFNF